MISAATPMTEEEIREVKSRLAVEVDQTDERDTNDCTNGDAQRRIHAVRGDHRGSDIPDKALLTAFVDSPGGQGCALGYGCAADDQIHQEPVCLRRPGCRSTFLSRTSWAAACLGPWFPVAGWVPVG